MNTTILDLNQGGIVIKLVTLRGLQYGQYVGGDYGYDPKNYGQGGFAQSSPDVVGKAFPIPSDRPYLLGTGSDGIVLANGLIVNSDGEVVGVVGN